jgi:hypothetical protein
LKRVDRFRVCAYTQRRQHSFSYSSNSFLKAPLARLKKSFANSSRTYSAITLIGLLQHQSSSARQVEFAFVVLVATASTLSQEFSLETKQEDCRLCAWCVAERGSHVLAAS